MKHVIKVTNENINLFSPYQGNEQVLKESDVLILLSANVPCVYKQKGLADSFSIYGGKTIVRYKDEKDKQKYMFNRFSINDKHTK